MKKLSDYLGSLSELLTRRDLEEDANQTLDILRTKVIPQYDQAANVFKAATFQSDSANNINKALSDHVKFRGGNFITALNKILPTLQGKVEKVKAVAELSNENDIANTAMSVVEYNVIRLLETAAFIADFAPKVLNLAVTAESNKLAGREIEIEGLTPAFVDEVKTKLATLGSAINLFDVTEKQLEDTLKALPDLTIGKDDIDAVMQTVGRTKIDPFQTRFIPPALNPFYHFGRYVAEYQVERYERTKDEAKMLEFKLMNYKNLQAGKPDPKIEKAIELTQERLDKSNYKLAKMKEKYGVEGV